VNVWDSQLKCSLQDFFSQHCNFWWRVNQYVSIEISLKKLTLPRRMRVSSFPLRIRDLVYDIWINRRSINGRYQIWFDQRSIPLPCSLPEVAPSRNYRSYRNIDWWCWCVVPEKDVRICIMQTRLNPIYHAQKLVFLNFKNMVCLGLAKADYSL